MRLDLWLWAVRLYKTRSLSQQAAGGGKVRVNGQRSKPGRQVRVGDRISVQHEGGDRVLIIKGLEKRRQSAPLAQLLYEETPESRAAREQNKAPARDIAYPRSRPNKKERRALVRLQRGPLLE
ncbi:MAG: S4 domain-containing protein [Kistimonas sp.]|nr:S4 domain-containing protein [Kistimonas sp.]